MLTMLDKFTYVAPSAGGGFNTQWMPFPSDYKNAELWVSCKTHDGSGTLTVKLQSSVDSDAVEDAATSSVTAASQEVTAVSSKLGPMVRLNLSSTTTAVQAVVSVWLLPKRD